jgi:hypothetical protein
LKSAPLPDTIILPDAGFDGFVVLGVNTKILLRVTVLVKKSPPINGVPAALLIYSLFDSTVFDDGPAA